MGGGHLRSGSPNVGASAIPALRAARVDPLVTLRE